MNKLERLSMWWSLQREDGINLFNESPSAGKMFTESIRKKMAVLGRSLPETKEIVREQFRSLWGRNDI